MKHESRVVIVGSGIIGLSHAIEAREAGYEVTLVEKSSRPRGASVRNFGTLWPIGLPFGPDRQAAIAGLSRWTDLAARAGFHADACGSLSIAHTPEAWAVLQEFAETEPARAQGFRLLDPVRTRAEFPVVEPKGLQGSLHSPWEVVVRSSEALERLGAYAEALGVMRHVNTPVIAVEPRAVHLPDRRLPYDHLLIAAGDEMRMFFPDAVVAAGLTACRLQMMRTTPTDTRLGAILTGDLTLAHYPAFRSCASLPGLLARLDAERAAERRHGIHVIAAQHADGSVTLGDSHEYGPDFEPGYRTDVERLILESLGRFATWPGLEIASRWEGVYLKSTRGELRVVLRPMERVTMVTAMGGLGMTLSWDLAARTVARWRDGDIAAMPVNR